MTSALNVNIFTAPESASSEHELYDAMTDLYPDWASHQTWLMFGLG